MERNEIDEAFKLSAGNIFIEEVEIKTYWLTPARKEVEEKYGKPEEVIDGKEILSKEYRSRGLYDVLAKNYQDKVKVDMICSGFYYAHVWSTDITLVIIDGIPVPRQIEYYSLIQHIPPSEVSSFEIIRCPTNFCELYYLATGNQWHEDNPRGGICGGIIAIYTRDNIGLHILKAPVGIARASVPVFSEPIEFYAPKYDTEQSRNRNIPDLRTLIHWEPVVRTDSLGNTQVNFHNADRMGEMLVVVEAISEKGDIGYQEIVYEVEGNKQKTIIVK